MKGFRPNKPWTMNLNMERKSPKTRNSITIATLCLFILTLLSVSSGAASAQRTDEFDYIKVKKLYVGK